MNKELKMTIHGRLSQMSESLHGYANRANEISSYITDLELELAEVQGALKDSDFRYQQLKADVESQQASTVVTDEQAAKIFHEAYERLAPDFGYKTRKASAVPWSNVPEQNKQLMISVAGEVLAALQAQPEGESDASR